MNDRTDFVTWLTSEMDTKYWNISELGKHSGLSRGAISNVIHRKRKPGAAFCQGIAQAFDLPVELVYLKAGLLRQIENPMRIAEIIIHRKANRMNDNQLQELIRYIDWMQYRNRSA
jgi:transcriptional regulator with XRE-family HTH domain